VNKTDTPSMKQYSKLHYTVALSREHGVLTVPKTYSYARVLHTGWRSGHLKLDVQYVVSSI